MKKNQSCLFKNKFSKPGPVKCKTLFADMPGYTGKPIGNKYKLPNLPINNTCSRSDFKKETVETKLPNIDHLEVSPESNLFLAADALETTNSTLTNHRRLMMMKMEHKNNQWKRLEEDEEILRQAFQYFQSFLHANLHKRDRVVENYLYSKALIEKREKDISILSEEMNKMNFILQKMSPLTQKFEAIYEGFLSEALAESRYDSINDFLIRYDCLMFKRRETSKRELELMKLASEVYLKSKEMIMKKTVTLHELLIKVNVLMPNHKNAYLRSIQAERLLVSVVDKINCMNVQIESALHSMYTIYSIICSRKEVPPTLDRGDYKNLMIYLKMTFRTFETLQKKLGKEYGR